MKKALCVALLCAGASLYAAPAVQAHEAGHAVAIMVADNNSTSNDNSKSEGTVHKCIKWIEKKITEIKDGKTVTRTVAVCAVRG